MTNAIYFSAARATPFDKAQTRDAAFDLLDGSRVDVPTMHQSVETHYGEGEGGRAVGLPYDGHQLSMTIVVPDDLRAFEAGLTGLLFMGRVADPR